MTKRILRLEDYKDKRRIEVRSEWSTSAPFHLPSRSLTLTIAIATGQRSGDGQLGIHRPRRFTKCRQPIVPLLTRPSGQA